jgi:histone demethylase JARID1
MSGISVPWLYLGMKYANFCWHKEDLNLNSMNYMHAGAPKTWYAIPPCHSDKFLEYFNSTYSEERKHNPRLLYDIVC